MNEKDIQRFWSKVDKSGGEDACWMWMAYTNINGYGVFRLGHPRLAHRIAWMTINGSIPPSMCICHHCDNPSCVNPSHLFLGTNKDNIEDRERKGRGGDHRGERHGRAKVTLETVRQIRALYAEGKITQKELGKIYGISNQQVSNIIRKQHWTEEFK